MRDLINDAVDNAVRGDAAGFVETTKKLEHNDWAESQEDILHSLAILAEIVKPDLDPSQASEVASGVQQRFAGSFAIQQVVLESVLRGVAGEPELLEGMPHNVLLLYALLLTSELIMIIDAPTLTEIFEQIDRERAADQP